MTTNFTEQVRWTKVDNGDGTFSFKSYNNTYLSAQQDGEPKVQLSDVNGDREQWTELEQKAFLSYPSNKTLASPNQGSLELHSVLSEEVYWMIVPNSDGSTFGLRSSFFREFVRILISF